MFFRKILITISLAATLFTVASAQGVVADQQEFAALKSLYDSLAGANWTTKTNWPTAGNWPATASAEQMATWYGITVTNGDITTINLTANNLFGRLPASIGQLKGLTELTLSNNRVKNIPASLGTLPNLKTLVMNTNFIAGAIPASLSDLVNLETLDLNNNTISGVIPDLHTLTKLKTLGLHRNTTLASGSIPSWIQYLTNLSYLNLQYTNRTGSIPAFIGNLTALKILGLHNNQLSGSIPPELGNLVNLTTLLLSDNQLSGSIPASLGNLTKVAAFHVGNNQLSGSLPEGLTGMGIVAIFNIANNKLTGTFPTTMTRMTGMTYLYAANNQFSGRVPTVLAHMSKLYYLDLGNNKFSGDLPIDFAQVPAFQYLNFDNNELTSIPDFSTQANKANLTLTVSNNHLDFIQLEPLIGKGIKSVTYIPQKDIADRNYVTYVLAHKLVIESRYQGPNSTIISWQKQQPDGTWLSVNSVNEDASKVTFTKSNAVKADEIYYRWTANSSVATGLTLTSTPIAAKLVDEVDNTPVKGLYNGLIASTRWRTDKAFMAADTEYSGMYVYSYDDKYQIADARWGNANNTLNTYTLADNKYRLTGMSYDPNGNIITLKRYNNEAQRTNDFTYHYTANKNQLHDVTGYTNAYTYNAVGQMIGEDKVEEGKDQYVEYDVSGKVTKVYSSKNVTTGAFENLKVEFQYDDRGFRLTKINYETKRETWYIRDASGNVLSIYEYDKSNADNTKWTLTQTEVPIYGAGKLGTQYPQQDNFTNYEITDHLGNVRALVREEAFDETATMETARAEHETGKFLRYENVRKIYSPLFDHTNNAPPSTPDGGDKPGSTIQGYAIRLRGGAMEKRGLAKSFAIAPGDVIHMEVYAKYLDVNRNNWRAALNTLITQIAAGTAAPGTVVDGKDYHTNGDTPLPHDGLLDVPNGLGPKAYLGWLIFDKDFVHIDGGFKRMSDFAKENGDDVDHEKLEADLSITQPGYIYIYLSNDEETPVECYFDDFTVTHNGSYVSQATDYGVWGDVLREQKAKLDTTYLYRYAYQGKYAEKDEETGWSHFELREYDPVIGRWTSTDPYGQFYSPYVGMGNDPINSVDSDGGCTDCPKPGQLNEAGTHKWGFSGVTNKYEWIPVLVTGVVVVGSRYEISYGENANPLAISSYTERVLRAIMKESNNFSILITSTLRTPEDQARAMYDNLELYGTESQYELYGSIGDQIIDVYAASVKRGLAKAQVMSNMISKINAIGPAKVSRHMSDFMILNVIDISPRSIQNKGAFEDAVHKRGYHMIKPPKDPAYHVEIDQEVSLDFLNK